MPTANLSLTVSAANLKRLTTIRTILILALLASLAYLKVAAGADLVHPTYLAVLALFTLANLLTLWRIHQPWPVTDLEFFGQLLLDIGGLTLVLYLAGGATNPFISYYLVPITISAALLPRCFTWATAGISLLAYTLMLFYYQPLPLLQMHTGMHGASTSGPNLHVFGMWLTFALSTVLITHFVVRMAEALRQRDRLQASRREDDMRDEQLLAIASLAAGTAHELGTPLSTMMVLLEELRADCPAHNTALKRDLELLSSQVSHCQSTLSELVTTADLHSHCEPRVRQVKAYMLDIVDRWQLLRPEKHLQLAIDCSVDDLAIRVDPTLDQAIANLLNNAADAMVDRLELGLHKDAGQIIIRIRDDGPGLALDFADSLGKAFVTSKSQGLGLGLFLSHATVERCGGHIELFNHPGGGTVVEVRLPIVPEPAND